MLVGRIVNSEELTSAFKKRNGVEPYLLAGFIDDRGVPLFFYQENWYAPVQRDAGQYKWVAYPFLNN